MRMVSGGRAITTIDDLEHLIRVGDGAILITDTAKQQPIAHRASGCSWLKTESFARKVVTGGGKTGAYYWFESLDAAVAAGARACMRCAATVGDAARPIASGLSAPTDVVVPDAALPFERYRGRGREASSRSGLGRWHEPERIRSSRLRGMRIRVRLLRVGAR